MNNEQIRNYLLSTFLASWLLWGCIILAQALNLTVLTMKHPLGMLLYVFGGISPAICEIVLMKRTTEKEEFRQFVRSILNPRHSILFYIYAVLGALLIQAIPVFFHLAEVRQPLYMGFLMILPMIIGGGVEEIGWRGLLQPQLEKNFSHITAAVSVGIIWAFWHLPLWFIEGTSQYNMKFGWFCINAIMLSFFIGSVTYVSKSIFMAILAHASTNAFWEVMPATEEILPSIILTLFVVLVTMTIDHFVTLRRTQKKTI